MQAGKPRRRTLIDTPLAYFVLPSLSRLGRKTIFGFVASGVAISRICPGDLRSCLRRCSVVWGVVAHPMHEILGSGVKSNCHLELEYQCKSSEKIGNVF